MQCNCINEVTKKLEDDFKNRPRYKKPVKALEIVDVTFTLDKNMKFSQRTYSRIEIELEGQKKKTTMSLFHSFCPFCGEKATKDEQAEIN